jgi:hypothetical protein
MKRFFLYVFLLIGSSGFLQGCTKKAVPVPIPNNTMSAQIGTIKFNSTGNDISVVIAANPLDTSKTALYITGLMDVGSSALSYISIGVLDYDKSNGIGTYNVSSSDADGIYDPGSGLEDYFIDGYVVVTASGSTISGTFQSITQSGSIISNGTFSVEP